MNWTVTSMIEGHGLVKAEFEFLTEALNWIPTHILPDREIMGPEDQGYTHIAYTEPADFFAVEGDYALVFGRIVCKVIDGWAGGCAFYKLQLAGQWTRNDTGESVTGERVDGTRFIETPLEFWVPEGSTSEPKNFPAPGASSDLILFSRDHL